MYVTKQVSDDDNYDAVIETENIQCQNLEGVLNKTLWNLHPRKPGLKITTTHWKKGMEFSHIN